MSLTLRGRYGELVWGYHVAATVGAWTVTSASAARSTLSADVQDADAYRITQRPLVFSVPRVEARPWRWPVTTLELAGGTVTAVLGPFEE